MSEIYRAPKLIGVLLAAGIGSSALTGCSSEAKSWEVGVVCPTDSEAQVSLLNNYTATDSTRIELTCVDEQGVVKSLQGLELVAGDSVVIENTKEYSHTLNIDYDDEADGYTPEINLDAVLGTVSMYNAEVTSAAISN